MGRLLLLLTLVGLLEDGLGALSRRWRWRLIADADLCSHSSRGAVPDSHV